MARITKTEKQEIARLRKNYLAKRARLVKLGVDDSLIPAIPIPTTAMPRAQVNAIKSQMRSFTSRSNLHYQFKKVNEDLVVSKAQINELKRLQRRANIVSMKAYKRNLRAEFLPLSERGWALPGAHRTVESERLKKPPRGYTRRIETFRTHYELMEYMEHLQRHIDRGLEYYDNIWRENTIKALIDSFGETQTLLLVKRLRAMPLDEFVFMMETQDIDLNYFYPSAGSDQDEKIIEAHQYFDETVHRRYLLYKQKYSKQL